jgi:hypothetical protein
MHWQGRVVVVLTITVAAMEHAVVAGAAEGAAAAPVACLVCVQRLEASSRALTGVLLIPSTLLLHYQCQGCIHSSYSLFFNSSPPDM